MSGILSTSIAVDEHYPIRRLLKKSSRKPPGGGLGVSPSFNIPPRLGDKGVDKDFFSTLIQVAPKNAN